MSNKKGKNWSDSVATQATTAALAASLLLSGCGKSDQHTHKLTAEQRAAQIAQREAAAKQADQAHFAADLKTNVFEAYNIGAMKPAQEDMHQQILKLYQAAPNRLTAPRISAEDTRNYKAFVTALRKLDNLQHPTDVDAKGNPIAITADDRRAVIGEMMARGSRINAEGLIADLFVYCPKGSQGITFKIDDHHPPVDLKGLIAHEGRGMTWDSLQYTIQKVAEINARDSKHVKTPQKQR